MKAVSKKAAPSPIAPSLVAQIAALETMRTAALKALWQKLYESPPTVVHRRFLQRRLAYRLQELASREAQAALLERNERRIARLLELGTTAKRLPYAAAMAGTVFTREYGGQTHRVVATTEGAFEYQGRRYGSLSVIAREITGTRWSGPAFFGLRKGAAR